MLPLGMRYHERSQMDERRQNFCLREVVSARTDTRGFLRSFHEKDWCLKTIRSEDVAERGRREEG